jgi:uncharacterized protein
MKEVISWFEIPSNDFDRACKFYNNVFQVELESCEIDGLRMAIFPDPEEGSTGAVVYGEGHKPAAPGVMVYLSGGEDLMNVLKRVKGAGGKIVVEKTMIPEDMGYFAIFQDTEGNQVGLHSMG